VSPLPQPSRRRQRVPTHGSTVQHSVAEPLRACFDAWLEDAVTRHSRELEFREIRKGVQAVSHLYVQRRDGVDLGARALEGRGKRAALATFFAPLHFLTVHHLLTEVGPARLGAVRRVLDLGCGTGAAGAAATATLAAIGTAAEPPSIVGLDRSGYVLAEARHTYAHFGLVAQTLRGQMPDAIPETGAGDLLVFGWSVNELGDRARRELWETVVRALAHGARLLLLEPLAGPASPWWRAWAEGLSRLGVEEPRHKFQLVRPEWIARLDKAAGLDHRTLGARVLIGPLTPATDVAPS
jgi:SAM-dependent methyltransferase